MNRRSLLYGIAVVPLAILFGVRSKASADPMKGKILPLEKSKKEWRVLLVPDQYEVLFRDGTERPFSSDLNDEKRKGTYICGACYLPLFTSDHKYDSGTGWPSFTQPIADHVETKKDFKLLLPRTEYHCARCSGHQGHRFSDGPKPRRERWCNNGVALQFVPETATLPELRI